MDFCRKPGCDEELPPDRVQERCTECKRKDDEWLKERPKQEVDKKECSSCNRTKPVEGFYKDARAPDGYCWTCKECQGDYDYTYGYGSGHGWRSRQGEMKFNTLVKEFGAVCPDCGVTMTGIEERLDGSTYEETHVTVDHIIPQALGGIDGPPNLRLCCWQCNQRKGNDIRLDLLIEHNLFGILVFFLMMKPRTLSRITFVTLSKQRQYLDTIAA